MPVIFSIPKLQPNGVFIDRFLQQTKIKFLSPPYFTIICSKRLQQALFFRLFVAWINFHRYFFNH